MSFPESESLSNNRDSHNESNSAQFGPNGLALAYESKSASSLDRPIKDDNESESAQFGHNGLALAAESKSASNLEQSIYTTEPLLSCERNPKARPGSPLDVPSESVTFCDKRRRLLSTPLITGYYVSDRPPDSQTHNNSER